MQPVLETRRLRLRPSGPDDLDALWALWIDPEVRRFLWDDVAIDRDKARETMEGFSELSSRGLGLWTIDRGDSGAFIGCAALSPVGTAAQFYRPIADAIEPLVALTPAAWHHGYASEVLTALIEYANTLNLDSIAAVVDVPNIASNRLAERAGFVMCAETDGPKYRLRHYRYESHRGHQ